MRIGWITFQKYMRQTDENFMVLTKLDIEKRLLVTLDCAKVWLMTLPMRCLLRWELSRNYLSVV